MNQGFYSLVWGIVVWTINHRKDTTFRPQSMVDESNRILSTEGRCYCVQSSGAMDLWSTFQKASIEENSGILSFHSLPLGTNLIRNGDGLQKTLEAVSTWLAWPVNVIYSIM